VLYQLANVGPTMQRDLVNMLNIERTTLGVVTTLVRKGLVAQAPDSDDQRQHMLRITRAGSRLWEALPNPIEQILKVAFADADPAGPVLNAVLLYGQGKITPAGVTLVEGDLFDTAALKRPPKEYRLLVTSPPSSAHRTKVRCGMRILKAHVL
jgi:DNA-binding MarR family transcriptional regulator